MARSAAVLAVTDVPEGQIRPATLPNGRIIALYNVAGEIYATDDLCTHAEASLSDEGTLNGKYVECAWHFGTFDVTNGEPGQMPCEVPLKTYPVNVIDGMIHVEF